MQTTLDSAQLEALRRLDTCTVSNAIETFEVRLRNAGFADSSIRCIFPQFSPVVGYAVTARVRCSVAPMKGSRYMDRTDFWNYLLTKPAPRIVVFEDVDRKPGLGSYVGEIHANILLALGCVGLVTNGTVRDLGGVEPTGFQFFAAGVAVSHAYAHILEFGNPVEVGGLKVQPGELLHGDRHGVLAVPMEIAARIPGVAADLLERERRVIGLCRSPDFSLEKLQEAIKELR
ncbi:MAG TPA: RraA family protein [Terriglobia bacterium]|nr:RraA family protein [Terriglobia bacterium]